MDYFKHYVGAHESDALTELYERMGHTGLSCYWILVELCAEKLDIKRGEYISILDCVFKFHERLLRDKFRLSPMKLKSFLNQCSTLDLLSFTQDERLVSISLPKLLECLDRDARIKRVKKQIGPLDKEKEEEKELDKDKEEKLVAVNDSKSFEARFKFDHQRLVDLWPKPTAKGAALKRMQTEYDTQEKFDKLEFAINNCLEFHRVEQTEHKFHPSLIGLLDSIAHWSVKRSGKPPVVKAAPFVRNEPKPINYGAQNESWQREADEREQVKQQLASLTPEQQEERKRKLKELAKALSKPGLSIPAPKFPIEGEGA